MLIKVNITSIIYFINFPLQKDQKKIKHQKSSKKSSCAVEELE